MTGLWWVRRDARLGDNPALLEAQSGGRAAAVFAWTPALDGWSGRRRAHLARVLWSLRENAGGAVAVRRGTAPDVVVTAAREAGARVVWGAEEYSPSGTREQVAVALALAADGRELRLVGSPYAAAPGTVTKADGPEYRVFTPFYRAWRERVLGTHGWDGPPPPADPARFAPLAPGTGRDSDAGRDSDVDLDSEAARGDLDDPLGTPHEFGEARALDRLHRFAASGLADYDRDRDLPDLEGTSGLSVALAFGELHPRTILAATRGVAGPAARAFERQLAWRDFHADVLWRHPRAMRESLTAVVPNDAWASGPGAEAHFVAWRDGLTGFPLVDAGMRELAATGAMHGRARMVAASFLVKDLHLPWQRGADHFRRMLLDYDHAQNQLNWQWVAGTGRDAAPYYRVFNPELQAHRYDPERRYVERWVPELDTPAYPTPIVDHAVERRVALDAARSR
jgi:deoxyribodipyrimidine photo-lyase